MVKRSLFFVSVALIMIAVGGMNARAAVNMHEGEWENSIEMKMEGLPFQMPAVKTTQCITRDDLVPRQSEGKSKCKTTKQSITGNKVSWASECIDEHGNTTESQGEITYSGDGYKGTMSMKTKDKSGQVMTGTATMNGRRLGACGDKSRKKVMVGDQEVQQPDPAMMEQAKQAQADYQKMQAENKARSAEFVKLTVPAEDKGACLLLPDFADSPDCKKIGTMNLTPGQWEITLTQGTKMKGQTDYMVGEPRTETDCLMTDFVVPGQIRSMIREAKYAKKSAGKVTWRNIGGSPGVVEDERGGIIYSGTSLEGVVVKTQTSPVGRTEIKTKITGRLVGKGDCRPQGRDYTSQKRQGRDYTSTGRSLPSPGDAVNKLKGLFGR